MHTSNIYLYRLLIVLKTAGDKAPEVPRAEIGEQFRALMEVESKQFSLPASIKTLVENSTGVTQTVHMYDNLTMVVMGVHDLEVCNAPIFAHLFFTGMCLWFIYAR